LSTVGPCLALLVAAIASTTAAAQDSPSFAGKTVTVIVGAAPGGSTDTSARLIAPYLAKYLPGAPAAVVQNRPGASGMTALNVFANQVAPNGLTAVIASGSQIDPMIYRVPHSQYDPSKFAIIGGVGIGGSIILIHNKALPRLTEKGAPPVVVGTISGVPRSGMQMAAWGADYLGWNIKWITGYRGNPELMLAFERGEIDMTAFANTTLKPELFDKGKYTILYQSGSDAATVPATMPQLAAVPLLTDAMQGKISDPLAQNAFRYWQNISSINNWIGLPPNTPGAIVETYRAAYRKTMVDPDFLAQAAKMGNDVTVVSPESMEKTINTLAALPPEALGYMRKVLVRQGLNLGEDASP
jgi:tripartite-type tricarboxylate transporter receptor subunit TctC